MFQNYATQIAEFQCSSILRWKKTGIDFTQKNLLALVEENHAFNFQLWHAEDRARRDDLGFEFVYRAKREIDHCNQQRNNRMEAMDEWLFEEMQPAPVNSCPVHSETPGMMIDRLSILALKAYHMALQLEREDVDGSHHLACKLKLEKILAQQQQLQDCLHRFLQAIHDKSQTFRVYHQFKMYNDPMLNPELSARHLKTTAELR